MTMPRAVLITGVSGSGKSTLARDLSRAMRLPSLARDQVRGGLFFTAGAWRESMDRVPSSDEAVDAFLTAAEAMLVNGVSCILEYVVRAHRPEDLDRLLAVADVVVIKTEFVGALERFAERHRSDRLISNPAVLDATGFESVDAHTAAAVERMRQVESEMMQTFPVPTLVVDTTGGYAPGLDDIVDFVTSAAR